jgi:hypothetical protein
MGTASLTVACEVKHGKATPYAVYYSAQSPGDAEALARLWTSMVQAAKATAKPREAPRERQP